MPIVIPQTLRHAFTLYADSHPKNKVADLRTVLRLYILPFLPGKKFTPEIIVGNQILGCLAKILMIEFSHLDCRGILEGQLHLQTEAGNITKRTADNYLSDYDAFVHWTTLQDWYDTACGGRDTRYTPRLKTRGTGSLAKARRGKGKNCRQSPYALKQVEVSSHLAEQLEEYYRFWTDKEVETRQDDQLRRITFSKHRKNIFYFLGWLKHIEGERIKGKLDKGSLLTPMEEKIAKSLDNLALELFEDIKLLKKYVAWGINKRGSGHGWAETAAKASLSVTKFLRAEDAPHDYRGITSIDQIRIYLNKLAGKAIDEAEAADTTEKELTHAQCVEVVNRLRRECAPRRYRARKRSIRAISLSWERYLIIAILTYCPIRSRELRELQLNKTLFKEGTIYRLKLKPEDTKTGKVREVNLSQWLPADVLADLEQWLTVWRPKTKAALQTLDQWLVFWDYSQSDLDKLTGKLENARGKCTESYVNQLEAQIRGLQNLINIWHRSEFHPDHDYVFFSLGSVKNPGTVFRPYYNEDLDQMSNPGTYFGRLVKGAVFRVTALLAEESHPLFINADPKHTHPHFFRHIDSTHLRRQGASYEVLKAFHEGIGNSVEEGDRSYDLTAPGERTAAAARWWAPNEPQDDDEKMEIIKKLLFELPPERRRIIKDWI